MSSLKKALNKIRTDRSSRPSSDDESRTPRSATRKETFGSLASSTGSLPASPRHSGTFTRSSGTWNRNSLSVNRSSGQFSPVRLAREKLGLNGDDDSSSDVLLNRDGEPMSKNQQRKAEQEAAKEARKKEVEQREQEIQQRRKELEERAAKEETPEMRALYGNIPVNHYGGKVTHTERATVRDISAKDIGKEVLFRARIHNLRRLSAHLVFFVLRQQTATIQGVLQEHGNISPFFLYWAEHLDAESVVLVKGVVQEPKAKQGEVLGTTVHDAEIAVHSLHVEGKIAAHLPFTVEEAEVPARVEDKESDGRIHVPERARLANRVIDLRTTSAQSIFRIQAGIGKYFREYLDSEGFVEIHTPKLQGGATESGASVFKLDYFRRPAFLAQSPQLAKQMSIAADFGRVFEVGPVFRAENSNTHRHMTEFTGLDLEMAINDHYHEVLNVLISTFKHIFEGIYKNYRHELDIVKTHFPHEDLKWLDETPVIPFAEGIRMLNETGYRDEDGKELDPNEDMGTRDEIAMGAMIKEKFGTDFYVLDKFPVSARPFYAMPDAENPQVTNSFDIFLRGQEILSGGQRIHDAETLLEKMANLKMDRDSMDDYIQGFEWGAPPHGGGGIGLERMLFLLLNLGDIRHGSLFPRDPKSFPAKPAAVKLRHPEASTMHPPWEGRDRMLAGMDLQPIEKLIANYGDASNTSWLEPRTEIWRDDHTGAAVGFVPQDGFAIIVGDPLCEMAQYTMIITHFLTYLKKNRSLKPLWLLVGPAVETVLAERFNWRTFSVVAELRLDPAKASDDGEVQRKIRHAQKEGVKLSDISLGGPVPDDLKEKTDKRVVDWHANRKGKQVHLTDIHLWQDMEHRAYHFAYDSEGTVVAVVAIAQLAPQHGWQIKYALDFPGAPSGTIEYIVTHALKGLAAAGETNVTFGGGASNKFTPGHNLKGTRVKVLSKAYHAIMTELRLTAKSEFREKLGAQEDPVYLCYPPKGLGPMGVKAILNFFEDE
jgi:ergosteryl-3beta-O-L-aspartate synthase